MNKKPYLFLLKKYEIIIGSVGVIITVFILSFLFLLPNFDRAQEIYRNQTKIKQKLDKLKQKDNFITSLDYKYYQDLFPKINMVIPDNKDYVSLFQTFDNLEKKTGVVIHRTDFQLGVVSTGSAKLSRLSKSGNSVLPVTLEISGNYDTIRKFIESVTDLTGRLITLTEAKITYKDDNELRFIFNGNAYFNPLPQTIGSVESSIVQIAPEKEDFLKKISQIQLEQSEEISKVEVGKTNIFE